MEDRYYVGGKLGTGAQLVAGIHDHDAQAEAEWEALRVRRGWTPEQLTAYRYRSDNDVSREGDL